jgi:hypothetical protein
MPGKPSEGLPGSFTVDQRWCGLGLLGREPQRPVEADGLPIQVVILRDRLHQRY